MGDGPSSDWYQSLNQAPWTPPGWVFGFAWTTIMICFALYMAVLWKKIENRNNLLVIYGVQVLLNVSWNPIFFNFHYALYGLFIIILLTFVVAYILVRYGKVMGYFSLLIVPYFLWLLVATSLNWYITVSN